MTHQRIKRIVCRLPALVLFGVVLAYLSGPAAAREAVDMDGRRIVVPDRITRVYGASPPSTYLLYALDPTLLVGLNFPLKEGEQPFLHPRLRQLPVVGGYFGQGQTPNLEALLAIGPQLVLGGLEGAVDDRFEPLLARHGLPIAHFNLERLADYPQAIRVLGRILDRNQRAEELAGYGERVLADILKRTAAIPATDRPRVYYAEGLDGLSTDCSASLHAELIELAGGYNVHRCQERDVYGMEKVNLEQVLLYRPEVIFVREPAAYKRITSSPQWRNVPAVRSGRVYRIPMVPFDWFDRPPSFMRLLGLQWTAAKLHPQRFPKDLVREAQRFYRLFLQVEVSEKQLRQLLASGKMQP
jgi:iron complex transport system substrate-binding protein